MHVNNSNPNHAVEVLQTNSDGTTKVKFVTQYADGAMLYGDIVDGVQIEVIKIGDEVTSAYPTGGVNTGLLVGFTSLK